MTTDREMERIVRSWLEPGLTTLTDDVLDPVLNQLPATPQRRPWWPARRIADMNLLAKYAVAATAVVVIAIVGFNLLGASGTSQVGAPPSAPASPSTAPSASPPPVTPTSGALEAGPYRWTAPRGEVAFVVPNGWTASTHGIGKPGQGTDIAISHNLPGSPYEVTHVFTDACQTDLPTAPNGKNEQIGPTATDLVKALEDQLGTDATTSSFAGGQLVEIREGAGLDRSTCTEGADGWLKIWADNPPEDNYFPLEVGHWAEVYIFEHDGERFVFSAAIGNDAPAADVEELHTIVESFEFSTP